MNSDFVNTLVLNVENLEKLDQHFRSTSYCCGFLPTEVDSSLFSKLKGSRIKLDTLPNLHRWWNHIYNLSQNKSTQFPKLSTISSSANKMEESNKDNS
uniref:GST C-terminal domain-containing protein n=2 Tax=Ciona intestinalis TaxID=7719 RepID=H2XM78_CIOIN